MDISLLDISIWLKSTVLGIVILGAIGSIVGVMVLWVLTKIFKRIAIAISNTVSENTFKVIGVYIKGYLRFRGTLLQLINKNKVDSVAAFHANVVSKKTISVILSWLLFITCYFIFLFFDTEYIKTSVFFVALFFLFLHDACMYAVCQWLIEHYLFGREEEISKSTYSDESIVLLETIILIKENTEAFKDFDISKLLKKNISNEISKD